MALHPQFHGHRYGSTQAKNTIEIYLDKKMYDVLDRIVFPLIDSEYNDKVSIIFRNQVQSWHPSSTMTHEASLAVEKVDPTKFFAFSKSLFGRQTEFFDTAVQSLSREQIYNKLADIAESVNIDRKAFLEYLFIPSATQKEDFHNNGNKVTNDLKLTIKLSRQNSIHVSPTVVTNGLIDNGPSSSWTDEWRDYLAEL